MDPTPRISVVDDDDDVRFSLEDLLRSAGHSARTFSSAEEALADPHIADSSCVITDLQMGGLNGLEFSRLLRSRSQSMPILLMTAYPTAEVERRACSAHLLFLRKPFEPNAMLAIVRQMLDTAAQ